MVNLIWPGLSRPRGRSLRTRAVGARRHASRAHDPLFPGKRHDGDRIASVAGGDWRSCTGRRRGCREDLVIHYATDGEPWLWEIEHASAHPEHIVAALGQIRKHWRTTA